MSRLLSHLVERSAGTWPDATAVRSGPDALSYAEVATRAGRMAAALHHCGVRTGDRVGIYVHKSVLSYVAVHAVLRCGAAYVPLDPAAPTAHVRSVMDDCGITLLISEPRKARELVALSEAGAPLRHVIGVDTSPPGVVAIGAADLAAFDPRPVDNVLADDLAYVMYTSGSTGRPKGIMHTHRSGLSYAGLARHLYGVGPGDRLANTAPLHFDISTFDVFTGPLAGACTLMIPEPYLKMPASLSQLVQDQQATVWYSVPFLLAELLHRGALEHRDLSALRWVMFGGEVMEPQVVSALMRHAVNARFSNVYGPAEVNQCTYHHLPGPPAPDTLIPIGRAWDDADVLIVDDRHDPVNPGETGELLVRTSTMMDGYWQRPDLTAAGFVQRALPGGRTARWYATGDLGRRRPDGEIEFLGRRDHQVKVRGNRVELEAVEAALLAADGVQHAIAGLVQIDGQQMLGAAVVLADPSSQDDDLPAILKVATDRLPPYAVPHRLVQLRDLPLTGTGKIDRRAIRDGLSRLIGTASHPDTPYQSESKEHQP